MAVSIVCRSELPFSLSIAASSQPWPASWALRDSSTCYPNNEVGYFTPPANQPWGLVPVSWTNAMNIWQTPDPFNSTCEAAMLEGCRIIKSVSPATRCFRYNNMEREWTVGSNGR